MLADFQNIFTLTLGRKSVTNSFHHTLHSVATLPCEIFGLTVANCPSFSAPLRQLRTVEARIRGAFVHVDVAVEAGVSGCACAVVGSGHGRARGAVVTRVRVARARHQLAASTAETRRTAAARLASQILHGKASK